MAALPAKRGKKRPGATKYEPERAKRICDALALGATHRLAAAYGGIHEQTFINWRDRHPEFAIAIEEAEARCAMRHLMRLEEASKDPKNVVFASSWILERRFNRDYGQRQRIDHSGTEDGPPIQTQTNVDVNVVHNYDFDWNAIEAHARQITGGSGELPPGDGA
jgi:hypothetical protein